MATAVKVALILLAFVVVLAATAATMELSTGKSHSGYVSFITVVLMSFIAPYIWRR